MKYWLLIIVLLPALAVPCGTPCDKQGQEGAVDQEGACVLLSETCEITEFYWVKSKSNTSSLFFYGSVDSLCGEQALCNLTINSDTRTLWSDELVSGYAYQSPPLEYGTNKISLNCTCNSTNVSSTKNATSVQIQADVVEVSSDAIISPGHVYETSLGIQNKGNIKSSFTVYDRDYEAQNCTSSLGSPLSLENTTQVILNPLGEEGDYAQVSFNRSMPCGYSGYALHEVNVCESGIGCPGETHTEGCFQVYECYDYGGAFDSDEDCQLCKGQSYICSDFHCCPYYEHWENGACCNLGEACCTDNTDCASGFRCDPSLNYCTSKVGVGGTCTSSDDCQSDLHCDADSALSTAYCTYNDTGDAGISGDCWDEEDWNTSSPYYGCDGCATNSHCNASFYCDKAYALCRDCPEGPGSVDGICSGAPTLNCFNLDQDCCDNDANCTTLEDDYYCDTDSKVCRECEIRQDYYCPSPVCYGIDPDCCETGITCPLGSVCDETGTCIPQVGKECTSSEDCGAGNLVCEYSSCFNKEICMTPNFLSLLPSRVPVALSLGQTLPLSIIVSNPQGCVSNYMIYFTGPEKHFASFGIGEKSFNITLEAGESRKVPANFYAAQIGGLEMTVNVVDQNNPNLEDSKSLQVPVQGRSTAPGGMVTAPGISNVQFACLLILSFIFYSLIRA